MKLDHATIEKLKQDISQQGTTDEPTALAHIVCAHRHWYVIAIDSNDHDSFYGWRCGRGEELQGTFRFSEIAQTTLLLHVLSHTETGLRTLSFEQHPELDSEWKSKPLSDVMRTHRRR